MSVFSRKLALAVVLAALCLGGRTAHAQAAPMSYWIPNWPIGFGGNPSADQSSNTYGNFPSFDGTDIRGRAFSLTRYNFSNGWFVGSERGGLGSNASGFNQIGAFGNASSFSYEGVQLGYNLKNAPVTFYAGFDTLKYNGTGIGNPFSPFDSAANSAPGYSAHAGVEFRPTSNLSLSLGASFIQQGTDGSSLVLPGASPFAVGGRR